MKTDNTVIPNDPRIRIKPNEYEAILKRAQQFNYKTVNEYMVDAALTRKTIDRQKLQKTQKSLTKISANIGNLYDTNLTPVQKDLLNHINSEVNILWKLQM